MAGHTCGAAGGIEAGITALVLARGVLPPTTNYENPDPECDLDYVPNHPREVRVDHAMSEAEMIAAGRDIEATVLARAVRFHLEHRVLINGDRTVVFR